MNWIEIDKILLRIIKRHDDEQSAYDEAIKQFKWSQRQAEAAMKPLLKYNTNNHSNNKSPESKP